MWTPGSCFRYSDLRPARVVYTREDGTWNVNNQCRVMSFYFCCEKFIKITRCTDVQLFRIQLLVHASSKVLKIENELWILFPALNLMAGWEKRSKIRLIFLCKQLPQRLLSRYRLTRFSRRPLKRIPEYHYWLPPTVVNDSSTHSPDLKFQTAWAESKPLCSTEGITQKDSVGWTCTFVYYANSQCGFTIKQMALGQHSKMNALALSLAGRDDYLKRQLMFRSWLHRFEHLYCYRISTIVRQKFQPQAITCL